ncbi:hypothetical protein [Roseibium sp.]|uniref:hypothetical protein n=1 Tax=Roseibium sp. TaxID=1936156 RepID=UPI003BABB78E
MFFRIIFFAAVFVGFADVGYAQWLHQKQESAFGSDGLELIITASAGMGFGIRCSSESIEAVFITKDTSFDDETFLIANATSPKLLLRIDNEAPLELEGMLWDSEGKAAMTAEVEAEFIDGIANAKRRVSVAVKLLGEVYHETSFSAVGSTKAANKLKAGCSAKQSGS